MNKKYATIGFITSALLITIGSTAILAADETSDTSLEAGATQTTEPANTTAPATTTTTTEPANTAAPVTTTTTTEPANTAAPVTTTTTTEPASTATPAPAKTTESAPAEPVAKIDSTKKTLAKTTCEDFLGFDELIQAKYLIAAEAYAKGGKPKNIVIDVVASEALVPVLIEECGKTPKESFLTKLKSKLKR